MDEAPSLMGDTCLKQVTEKINCKCDEQRMRARSCLGLWVGDTEEPPYRKDQARNPAPEITA